MNGENNETKRNIFDFLREEIINSDLPETEKNRRLAVFQKANSRNINLMLVGATSSGKSSTINALFDMSVAKVGVGVEPETKETVKYELGNLTVWDTPGLGDTVENDKKYIRQIKRKLSETDENGELLIDLVMVVIDAASKDLAVTYGVINNTLIPCLGKDNYHRILIGINQSDMAMKGRHWDSELNAPDEILKEFLKNKAESVKNRVMEATGVSVEPVCYCAGYTEDDNRQQKPYNLTKLLYRILLAVPAEKRILLADKLNEDEDNWLFNDGDMDYTEAVKDTFFNSFLEDIEVGAENGAVIGGCVLGVPGMIVGGLIGGILGGLHALIIQPLSKRGPLSRLIL